MDLLDRLRVDHPVAQAGMGNIAPPALAAAVARAGGLGTIGMCAPSKLTAAIDQVRQEAGHVEVCVTRRVDVVVVAFGGDATPAESHNRHVPT